MVKKVKGVLTDDLKYCPSHKNIRLKSVYVRGPRRDGQPWLVLGGICPICHHQDFKEEVLTSGY